MLGIFSQGCRAFLWFCSSADPLLCPPHSIQEMCLSFPTALCRAARFLSGVPPAELKSSTPLTSELLSSLTPGVSLLAAARGRFMPPESLTQPHCEILSPWDTKSWQLLKAYSAVSQQISPHDQFEKIKLLLSSSALSYSCMTCWPFRAAQLRSINPPQILSARESKSSVLEAARHDSSRCLDLNDSIKHRAAFSPGAYPHSSAEGKKGAMRAVFQSLAAPWA